MKTFFRIIRKGHCILCPFLFFLVACANPGPAQQEYNLSETALRAARDSEAKRYSPKVYSQARRYMRKAKKAFEEKNFSQATEYFKKSRYYSEKAENVSRVKMFKQGDMSQ